MRCELNASIGCLVSVTMFIEQRVSITDQLVCVRARRTR